MPDEEKKESAEAGSSEAGAFGPEGQPNEDAKTGEGETVSKEEHANLEKKLGEQGKELGDYRTFVESITPLLDKLDDQPELIQAILDGKITGELASAAMEGKVSTEDAKQVSDAHKQVKKEMGKDAYKKADAADIEKRIVEEVKKVEGSFDQKLKETESMRDFKEKVNAFMAGTPDFSEYAEEIESLILENPAIDDIELAYHVVKGKRLEAENQKAKEKENSEAAKDLALNATGGSSQGTQVINDKSVVDKLISGKGNPNVL